MNEFFVDPDISQARTFDTCLYHDPSFLNLCKEKIFAPSWQLIGNKDQASEKGSVYPFVLHEYFLNEPLLLTCDEKGKHHCLSNVCTHRGNILVTEKCKLHQLTCNYHGRRFSLDGKFVSMPEFREVKNFPSDQDHLKPLSVYEWGNLLFTSLSPAFPAEEVFCEIREKMHWFPMEKLTLKKDLSKDYFIKANWALYCENYLEGFHIPFVHPGLNDVLDFSKYTTDVFRYSSLQTGIAKENENCFDLPSDSSDYGKRVAGYYFWAFPNLMLNFYPWGISVNIVLPLNPNESVIRYQTYVCDESKLNAGAGGDLGTVEMEDEKVVENVQIGVRSRFYKHGRYSVTREQGIHHFHRLISEAVKGR